MSTQTSTTCSHWRGW